MKSQKEPEEMVELTPAQMARAWQLPDEDGGVLTGSFVRIPARKVKEWETRTGPLDVTFGDISLVTGIPVHTLHSWRKKGLLRVRVFSPSHADGLRVAPAELIRLLRKMAADRNCTTEVVETVAQSRARGHSAKRDAIIACGGTPKDTD
ncbi:hypothetical protein VT84_09125 [Gemmata sp. SH-PL17]|uniref:hypothetical protein n=1 Tax=Gemmata sp. SH-PL17 TaxID=1630693 RepID=UPI00078C7183|nr:hypothetical protein [Gemmata sp. SH-PL17]AMV24544.1 hypothetical protein VT84_09125 [Gemmata sp. SH-PL17]